MHVCTSHLELIGCLHACIKDALRNGHQGRMCHPCAIMTILDFILLVCLDL